MIKDTHFWQLSKANKSARISLDKLKENEMVDPELDNIEALKANCKKTDLTKKERESLRRDVKKILERREAEEKARRRAEMERFYELGLYA